MAEESIHQKTRPTWDRLCTLQHKHQCFSSTEHLTLLPLIINQVLETKKQNQELICRIDSSHNFGHTGILIAQNPFYADLSINQTQMSPNVRLFEINLSPMERGQFFTHSVANTNASADKEAKKFKCDLKRNWDMYGDLFQWTKTRIFEKLKVTQKRPSLQKINYSETEICFKGLLLERNSFNPSS